MSNLIAEIDVILTDFIKGDVKVENFEQYMALERIAATLNKYRKKEAIERLLED